ncbi:MAG: 4Fe-4S binding protein [Planctomycetota bacterium]
MLRRIVEIDEEKCDGCGLCIPSCHEGAIQLVDGKAKLISDIYCDGLGDCLGHCPKGAITLVERDADEYSEEAVKELAKQKSVKEAVTAPQPLACGCPGTLSRSLDRSKTPSEHHEAKPAHIPSTLENWPVQLHLISPGSPWLKGANLLIAADCVPFAFADFHGKFLKGRKLIICCPKLDDTAGYAEKLIAIFSNCDIASVEVVHMEVPCCMGLVKLVRSAIAASGERIPMFVSRIGIEGEVQDRSFMG